MANVILQELESSRVKREIEKSRLLFGATTALEGLVEELERLLECLGTPTGDDRWESVGRQLEHAWEILDELRAFRGSGEQGLSR